MVQTKKRTTGPSSSTRDAAVTMLWGGKGGGRGRGGAGRAAAASWGAAAASLVSVVHAQTTHLNNSKFFAGLMMIMLNIGSKIVQIQFSPSTEAYVRYAITKQVVVFAIAWLGTRDVYMALGLTAIFTVLAEYLFNEDSALCVVPQQYRLTNAMDTNGDGRVSVAELNSAIAVLEKAKRSAPVGGKAAATTAAGAPNAK